MSVQIIYKKILTLEVWHDYYIGQPSPPALPNNYDISDLLTIVPTSDCVQTLKNLRWVYRSQPAGGHIFANVNPVGEDNFATQVTLNEPYRLTFWLMVDNPYFANFTNLPLTTKSQQIYYFSNLSHNQGHGLFLTQPLPLYDPEKERYALGELVSYEGQILEAIKLINFAPTIPKEEDWQPIKPNSQYVSELDRLVWQPLLQSRNIANLGPNKTFRIGLVDVNQRETFVFEGKAPPEHPSGSDLRVNLNFLGQAPGRYQLTLDGAKIDEFVLSEPIMAQKAWGLVEIVLNPDLLSTEFSFLDYQNQNSLIRPKTYIIRLKNRGTRWRYYHSQPHGFEDANPDSDAFLKQFLRNFEIIDKTTYATKNPFGLRLKPSAEDFLKDGQGQLLPIPGVSLIKPEKDETDKQINTIWSDIYL